jgi:hypothetical protein
MVRKIRDKQYVETKNLSIEDQISYIKKKATEFQKRVKVREHAPAYKKAQTSKLHP